MRGFLVAEVTASGREEPYTIYGHFNKIDRAISDPALECLTVEFE